MKKIFLTVALLLALISPALAVNYCVSTSGSDSNDGIDDGSPACWLTIQRANTTVVAGDSVGVNSGVYAITSTIDTTKNGTSAAARIRYYSKTPLGAIIRPTSAISVSVWYNHGNWVDIEGFAFDGANDGGKIRIGVRNDGTNVRVINNHIHDHNAANAPDVATSGGGAISNIGDNLTATGNWFHHVGLSAPTNPGVHGIYNSSAGGGSMSNNLIHDMDRSCILIPSSGVTAAVTIANNTVHNCTVGIWVLDGPGHLVYNNRAYSNSSNDIFIQAINGFYYNNTTPSAIVLNAFASGNTVRNNIALGGISNSGSGNTINTNITTGSAASHFVNSGAGDFHLLTGSGAKDTCATLGAAFNTDADGVSRPQGSAWDCGALEFLAVAVNWDLVVSSLRPPTGAAITISPADNAAQTNCPATPCTRNYDDGEAVTLTAPATTTGAAGAANTFVQWEDCDSVGGTGNRTCTVTMTTDRTVLAHYRYPESVAPVAHWKFDEPSGSNANDESANNNDGTLTNGPTWVAGKTIGGVQTDGVDDFIIAANHESIDLSWGGTLTVWVNPAQSYTDLRAILFKGAAYTLYGSSLTYCGAGGVVSAWVVSGSANLICHSLPLPALSWTHIAVTYDGATGLLTMYRNGKQVAQASALAPIDVSSSSFHMGKSTNGSGEHGAWKLDEVRIYNRALSPAEVSALAALNSGLSGLGKMSGTLTLQ